MVPACITRLLTDTDLGTMDGHETILILEHWTILEARSTIVPLPKTGNLAEKTIPMVCTGIIWRRWKRDYEISLGRERGIMNSPTCSRSCHRQVTLSH
jgi:hypothetical protein